MYPSYHCSHTVTFILPPHAHTHTHTHTHTRTHTHTCITHTHTYITHTHTYITHTHACTHTRTSHTRTHTHAGTHTHAHVPLTQQKAINSAEAYRLYPGQVAEIQRLDEEIKGGTTAVMSVVFKNKLYVANCGDSRAVLCSEVCIAGVTDSVNLCAVYWLYLYSVLLLAL